MFLERLTNWLLTNDPSYRGIQTDNCYLVLLYNVVYCRKIFSQSPVDHVYTYLYQPRQ